MACSRKINNYLFFYNSDNPYHNTTKQDVWTRQGRKGEVEG